MLIPSVVESAMDTTNRLQLFDLAVFGIVDEGERMKRERELCIRQYLRAWSPISPSARGSRVSPAQQFFKEYPGLCTFFSRRLSSFYTPFCKKDVSTRLLRRIDYIRVGLGFQG